MNRTTVIVTAVLLCALHARAQLVTTRSFSEGEGLPQKFIFSISQDTNGVLLLGTERGITAFNGNSFSPFAGTSGLPEQEVSALMNDGQGVTWVGHFQKGVTAIRAGVANVVDSSEKVHGRVQALCTDEQMAVLGIVQGKGLVHINRLNNAVTFTPGTEDVANAIAVLDKTIITGSNNGVVVFTGSAGVYKRKEVLRETIGYTISALTTTTINGRTLLFAAAEGAGVFVFQYAGTFVFHSFIDQELMLRDKMISAMTFDHNNILWIATMGEGVRKVTFDENGFAARLERLTAYDGLADDNIKSLYVDTENNIWLGTFGSGLVEIPFSAFQFYSQANGLLRKEVNCVTQDSFGTLWLGTDSGVTRFCGNSIPCNGKENCSRHFGAADGFADVAVTCMLTDTSGNIWIGTSQSGLFILDPCTEKFRNISAEKNLNERTINTLTATHDGRVIVGTTGGAYVYSYQSDSFTLLTTMEGLLHNDVRHLYTDHSNNVWFSSEGTPPYAMTGNDFVVFREIDHLRGYMISGVCEDVNGTRWIATEGDGVFSISTGGSQQYNSSDGLKSDHCISAITDNNGILWVVHKSGLSVKFPDDTVFRSFSGVDNALLGDFNAPVYLAGDGSIYFCSENGLVEIPPSDQQNLRRYPRVSLNRMFVNGKEVQNTFNLHLGAGKYNLEFDFNSILLSSSGFNSFYYRILGPDSGWIRAESPSIVIPQLSSGEYLLQVSGEPPGKMTQAPLNINIAIDLPLWRQPWFVTTAICLVPVLLLGGIRFRTQQLVRTNERLSVLVRQKTSLLELEKESVARMNVELKQKTKDITDSIQYAKRIQMAILPDVAIFKQAFPDSFLYYRPRDIVSGDFYWFAQRGDLFYIAIADCTGHGVPGAFMSMIGCTLMNKVVFDYRVDLPSGILDILNREIKMALHQYEASATAHDGMDVALCVIDRRKQVLHFSGAGRPLILVRGAEIIVHKTNKGGLGGVYSNKTQLFDEVVIPFTRGDMFYMFTDGYPDQFGFGDRFKFTSPSFRKLLVSLADETTEEQCQLLNDTFDRWKGDAQQSDDVLVAGFRIT